MKEIFHHYLYPFTYNPARRYTYNPDINGQFVIRTLQGNDTNTEADYAMMHFTLYAAEAFVDKDVHVYGAFNNFKIEEENKLFYNLEDKSYQGQIILKQGFYNYTFATVDDYNTVDTNQINGTYFQTENEYTAIVYYKPFGGLYDRVIGIGVGFFNQNR